MSLAMASMISDNSYLWAWKLERNETLHIHVQHGKSLQHVQYLSAKLLNATNARSTRHDVTS